MLFEIKQIGDLGPAPAVDALVIIADNAEVAMLLRQEVDEIKLRRVGVLVFVDHHVLEFPAAIFQNVRMLV